MTQIQTIFSRLLVVAFAILVSGHSLNAQGGTANDRFELTLNLSDINGKVVVSLIDYKGQIVETKMASNFRDGQFRF